MCEPCAFQLFCHRRNRCWVTWKHNAHWAFDKCCTFFVIFFFFLWNKYSVLLFILCIHRVWLVCVYIYEADMERSEYFFFFWGIYKFRFNQSRLRLPFGVVFMFEFGFVSPEWWSIAESKGFQKASLLKEEVEALWRFMFIVIFISGWKLENVSASMGTELERWWRVLERRCCGMEGEAIFGMGMSWDFKGATMFSEFFLLDAATLAV